MKKLLFFLFLSGVAWGQGTNKPTIIPFAGVPSGTCQPAQIAVNSVNGDLYDCVAGVWTLTGHGGGGISGSGTANDVTKFTGPTSVGNSSLVDDGTNPTQTPNGLSTMTKGVFIQLANANPGSVLNKTVCRNSSNQAITCATNATAGIVGSAGQGAGNSGNVQVCTTQCTVLYDNQTVIGDYAIPSVTTAGELHDSGTTETAGVQNFIVDAVNSGAGTTAQTSIFTPDQISGGNNGGGNAGKGTTVKVNGTISQPILNVQATTPAAAVGDTNCTWAPSNSGNTTSASCYLNTVHLLQAAFPAIATAQTALVSAPVAVTFPANFAATGDVPASAVKCGTNPSGTVVFTLTDVTTSVTKGTVSVSSSCVGTFATTGGVAVTAAIDDQLSLVSGTDASGLNITFNLRAY